MKLYSSLILLTLVFICCDYAKWQPMELNRDGEQLSCVAKYVNGSIHQVICFYQNGDTLLSDSCIDGHRFGVSTRWYKGGQVKEIGSYEDDAKIGEWYGYYEDGTLEYYRYYRLLDGKSQLYYEKVYDQHGEPQLFILPTEVSTNADSIFIVGKTYQLYVTLLYSQFDSVNSIGYIQASPSSGVRKDTIGYTGRTLLVEFTPEYPGVHEINGVYVELDGLESDQVAGYGGERPFKFEYEAVLRRKK